MEKNASADVLRIGDFVTLKVAKQGGLLCAEGILLHDLSLVEMPKVFDDALFCIHLQRQYSAAKELEEFLKKGKVDVRDISDANTAKYYQALKRGADNESRLNDNYLKKSTGRQVNFGDVIQLFHVKSGKYVKVLPDQLAKDERENIRIVLDTIGSSYSWLQVCPRYKIDREGDRVLNGAELFLKVAERTNEFVHRADRLPLPGQDVEVNCSLEATSFKLQIFRSAVDSVQKELLLSSELVYISDPETRCNLTLASTPLASLEGDTLSFEATRNGSGGTSKTPQHHSTPERHVDEVEYLHDDHSLNADSLDGRSSVGNNNNNHKGEDEDEDSSSTPEFAHEYGDAVLQAYDDVLPSAFLWYLEVVPNALVPGGGAAGGVGAGGGGAAAGGASSTTILGGPIKLKTDKVRLRHLNTSKYLKATMVNNRNDDSSNFNTARQSKQLGTIGGFFEVKEPEDASSEGDKNGQMQERPVFTTTFDPSDPETLFTVVEVVNPGKYLHQAKALQIGQNGLWCARGPLSNGTYLVQPTEDKHTAVNLFINRFVDAKDDVAAGTSPAAPGGNALVSTEPLDAYVGMSLRAYWHKYLRMTTMPKSSQTNTIWPTAQRADLPFFHAMVRKMVLFSQGFPISAHNVQLGIDKGNAKLKTRRQSLLREQGTLEVVLRLIHKLILVTQRTEALQNLTKKQKKQQPIQDSELAVLDMGKIILADCFQVLYYSLLDHAENQMYVADFLPDLLAHLSAQPMAGKCVTEMLSQNWALQETKISQREIAIFVDKLRASKMNAMYLQLLQSCCSCEGHGVDNNQGKVAEMLFADTHDIIIHLHADYQRCVPVSWVPSSGSGNALMNTATRLWSPATGSSKNAGNGNSNQGASLYIPSSPVPGSPVRADFLLTKGLPQLSLAWTTHSIDFSPLGLFGKLSVQVEELFGNSSNGSGVSNAIGGGPSGTGSPTKNASSPSRVKSNPIASPPGNSNNNNPQLNKKTSAALEQKRAVARYFVAELFLGAEMCMDRNYLAMHRWDALFPYEVLVSLLKMDLSHEIQAAAVRLLMCLHVDRDPQATTKIPVLTRAWSDIEKSPEPHLPCVESGRYYTFGLLQQLLSEHVRDMAGRRWDELSRHMLKMLRTLVAFNFYGTNERMQDVIAPLILALDRRHVPDINGSSAGSSAAVIASAAAASTNTGATGGHAKEDEDVGEGDQLLPKHTNEEDAEDTAGGSGRRGGGVLDVVWSSLRGLLGLSTYMRIASSEDLEEAGAGTRGDRSAAVQPRYTVPSRYAKAPTYELETMVEIVDILAFAQKVVEDRNLSLLLRAFYLWVAGVDRRSPAQIFEQVIEDSQALTMACVASFDDVMIDTLMFEHTALVQSALEVLMAHHSKRRTLLQNLQSLQLLASPERERQFRIVDAMLRQLEQNAETQELWGELESEADRAINNQTHDILHELIDICRIRHAQIDIEDENDDDYRPDSDLQDLYRNLGAFEICQKVLGLLDSIEEDDEEEDEEEETDDAAAGGGEVEETKEAKGDQTSVADKESGDKKSVDKSGDKVDEDKAIPTHPGKNTRKLCRLCNHLLYWFFLGNPANQALGYSDLSFFMETLDKDIDSHLVVRAIFANNEFLMRQVPHSHLNDLVNMIIDHGKSHHYLTLFTAITHVGDKNIYENQLEICKTLTSPGPLQKVSCYFVPVDHVEYSEKRALMAPYLDVKRDVSLEELPPLLSYHLVFLEVLSGCTVGSKNMTTIEAKVQSVYAYDHLLQSVLDPGTITLCKIRLSKFFYNSVIDVDLKIPGLEQSPEIWRLLESYRVVLGGALEQVECVLEEGWDSPRVSKQALQYVVTCIMIIGGFFEFYYQAAAFQPDNNNAANNTSATANSAATATNMAVNTTIKASSSGSVVSTHSAPSTTTTNNANNTTTTVMNVSLIASPSSTNLTTTAVAATPSSETVAHASTTTNNATSPNANTSSKNATSTASQLPQPPPRVQFSLTHVDEVIIFFFTKIKEIYDLVLQNHPDNEVFAPTTMRMLYNCLTTLNRSVSGDQPIVTFLTPPPHVPLRAGAATSTNSVSGGTEVAQRRGRRSSGAGGGGGTGPRRPKKSGDPLDDLLGDLDDDEDDDLDEFTQAALDPETTLLTRLTSFQQLLAEDSTCQTLAENENVAFIHLLEALPYVADSRQADVRYETLIQKLVFHIRENITLVNNQKRMDARCTATSTWIIRAFRTMIENRMGMSIYERDEEGGEEEDISAAPVVNALNSCGATALCLDLIAEGIDEDLQLEAIQLGVGLLFKEGGALEVQGIMHRHLTQTNSEHFFRQVRRTLVQLQAWHEWNGYEKQLQQQQQQPPVQTNSKGADDSSLVESETTANPTTNTNTNTANPPPPLTPPRSILLVRFLQLMCEGHYLPNQDILRDQTYQSSSTPGSNSHGGSGGGSGTDSAGTSTSAINSINVLDDLVQYLNFLSASTPCRLATGAALRVSATILEVIQGPCVGNQTHLTLNTELVETLNRILRGRLVHDCVASEEIELKKTAVDIFQGLLEGQGDKSVIYERVLSVLHLDIIQAMAAGHILQDINGVEVGGDDPPTSSSPASSSSSEAKAILRTECIVLLQMLRNFKPSLAAELGIAADAEEIVGSDTAMIEVVWRGEVHPRFFHVPAVCRYLAKKSKDTLVETIDRSNPENKLVDFLHRAHDLYLEVKHQEYLTHRGVSQIFSRENQNAATWITFYLAMVINVLLLFSYEYPSFASSSTPKIVDATVERIIFVLNILQSVVAAFVLLLFLVVRIPVKYQSLQLPQRQPAPLQGYALYAATAMEPMTLYYIWYLAFSILGGVYSYNFLPFLLMDIVVKNSTTRDVLNAVLYPRWQILMGGVVILIIVQIYTFFLFLYFRNELLEQAEGFCDTFWRCYLMTLGYGLRGGGGVGDTFEVSILDRWVLDITFFFIITVGMLNLIGGVIITTFGQLREDKARRLLDTVSVCFICGIDKQVFDRASDQPEGFRTHVRVDHNMWNYLSFIFLLWEQDKDDDDGLEQYVRRAIAAHDIAWFPMNKAIRLRQAATKEESMLQHLAQQRQTAETSISLRLERLGTDINLALEQLNQVLKQDQADANRLLNESRYNNKGSSRGNVNNKLLLNNQSALANNNMPYLPNNNHSGNGNVSGTAGMYFQGPQQTQRVLYLEVLEVVGVYLPHNALSTSSFSVANAEDSSGGVQELRSSLIEADASQQPQMPLSAQIDFEDEVYPLQVAQVNPLSKHYHHPQPLQQQVQQLVIHPHSATGTATATKHPGSTLAGASGGGGPLHTSSAGKGVVCRVKLAGMSQRIRLVDNVQCDDERHCVFRLFYHNASSPPVKTPNEGENGGEAVPAQEDEEERKVEVLHVAISLEELYLAEDTLLEVYVDPPVDPTHAPAGRPGRHQQRQQQQQQQRRKIVVVPTIEKVNV